MLRKKDILFLGLHRPNRSPSQRYRIEQFLPYLKKENITFSYEYLLNETMDAHFYSKGAVFSKIWIVILSFIKLIRIAFFTSKQFSIVFVQREAFMLGTSFFEKQIAKNAILFFDFDDSIWLSNVSEANKKWSFLKNPNKTKEIIQASSEVIVGNNYLANYAWQFTKKVNVIPTCVDQNEYKRSHALSKKEHNRVCIGWSGSQTTIEHFKLALPMLEKLKNKYGNKIYFKVMGDGTFYYEPLNIQGITWNKNTEIEVLEEFDIGIMPLPQDEWSKGKCGLKALVYLSMGIPAVIEDFGANQEIIQNAENGYLASGLEDWVDKLSVLIDNFEHRVEIGEKGHQSYLKSYSIQAHQKGFIDLIKKYV
jgi:glycosyltransferase involved in cell wall biosynthesis